MKIAIMSDIHDNMLNLTKFLSWIKENKIDQIICCGDVCNNETLKYLANNFKKTIYLVYGNAELYQPEETKKFKNINFVGRFGAVDIFGKKIGLCHEPWFVEKVQEQDQCSFIFYGHTHKPWEETKNNAVVLNPGTLGGVFYMATFAVVDLDNGQRELKILSKLK
ncbi:hypothetical protein COT95_01140 [Candidatus Falkowbacteria bacterium CG10_big_fil_rev_8_21_14_0_10_37_6]|uniref:Phosphoesterase n=1 Tax=Candidatus Falkowbacteria bacterium CG10_big_fil_rev_8_21_14_0_10_37_6 TaxID=1974563 RepID=A0A2H0V7D2_9BACT|nr:MAG: hypothetical protein COT95_01140 [Candidatus Falkowbacteria bacterium CG10_big_fil_rev_8_21_14_0_10_37_6]